MLAYSWSGQAAGDGPGRDLDAPVQIELDLGVGDVRIDGPLPNHQALANFAVAEPCRNERGDLELAAGQAPRWCRCPGRGRRGRAVLDERELDRLFQRQSPTSRP